MLTTTSWPTVASIRMWWTPCTCLSLQHCFWQQRVCLNLTTICPITSKAKKLKTSDGNSGSLRFPFYFCLPIQIINNEPTAPIRLFVSFSFAKNHLKSITGSLVEELFNVNEHVKDMPPVNPFCTQNLRFLMHSNTQSPPNCKSLLTVNYLH